MFEQLLLRSTFHPSSARGIFRHARRYLFCSEDIHEKATPSRGGCAKPTGVPYEEGGGRAAEKESP